MLGTFLRSVAKRDLKDMGTSIISRFCPRGSRHVTLLDTLPWGIRDGNRAVPSTAVALLVWHVPQLCVTLLALDEMPSMCCTSPAPLNHQSSRAFWGGAASCQVRTKSQAPSPSAVPLHSCTSDIWHPTPWQWHPPHCALTGSLLQHGVLHSSQGFPQPA